MVQGIKLLLKFGGVDGGCFYHNGLKVKAAWFPISNGDQDRAQRQLKG
jgi:hypothetical protein